MERKRKKVRLLFRGGMIHYEISDRNSSLSSLSRVDRSTPTIKDLERIYKERSTILPPGKLDFIA